MITTVLNVITPYKFTCEDRKDRRPCRWRKRSRQSKESGHCKELSLRTVLHIWLLDGFCTNATLNCSRKEWQKSITATSSVATFLTFSVPLTTRVWISEASTHRLELALCGTVPDFPISRFPDSGRANERCHRDSQVANWTSPEKFLLPRRAWRGTQRPNIRESGGVWMPYGIYVPPPCPTQTLRFLSSLALMGLRRRGLWGYCDLLWRSVYKFETCLDTCTGHDPPYCISWPTRGSRIFKDR